MAVRRALLMLLIVSVVVKCAECAAVRVRRSINTLPTYDEGFMSKLCAFLGATYVRSAKDPLCWYTWCHAGEPYHMQCAPGRSVSKHFYWSSEDPCTETDTKERCVVGYLKSMHLSKEEPDEFLQLEEVEEQVVEEEARQEERAEKSGYVESKQVRKDLAEQYAEPEMVVTEFSAEEKDEGGQEEPASVEQTIEEEGEEEAEPVPEPEPTPEEAPVEITTAKPKVVIKQIKQTAGKENYYYPGHGRAHIVDSFILQNPNRKYGALPKQTTPYIPVYYSPRPYFTRYRAPARIEPQLQPRAEFLRADNENEEDTEENAIEYKTPEGRQAPLSNIESEEPLYDAEYIGDEYLNVPAEKEQQEDGTQNEIEEVYENAQQVAPPLVEAVTALPPSDEQRDQQQGVVENSVEDYEETGGRRNQDDKEPIVYDYFKTHFVERM